MTDEEKKEFEEFLEWKRQRASQKQVITENKEIPASPLNGEKKQEPGTSVGVGDSSNTVSSEDNLHRIIVIIVICIGIAIFIVLLASKSNGNKEAREETSYIMDASDTSVAELAEEAEEALAEPVHILPVTWKIITDTDAMTDSKNIWASITSDDYVCQDFPYEGCTYAQITVRYMKKYGFDAIVSITKGQIHGDRYNGNNYITARFDDGSPKKYYYNEPADFSSDKVFLQSSSDFIKKCKQAKNIKIDIPIYQSGRPVFSFHVDEPLVWPEK